MFISRSVQNGCLCNLLLFRQVGRVRSIALLILIISVACLSPIHLNPFIERSKKPVQIHKQPLITLKLLCLLQKRGRCFCSNTFGKHGTAPYSDCSGTCYGDLKGICGYSTDRNAVYDTGKVDLPCSRGEQRFRLDSLLFYLPTVSVMT